MRSRYHTPYKVVSTSASGLWLWQLGFKLRPTFESHTGSPVLFSFLCLLKQAQVRTCRFIGKLRGMHSWWLRRSRKPKNNSSESDPRGPQGNPRSHAFKFPTKDKVQKKNQLMDPLRKSKVSGVDLSPNALSGFDSDGPSERIDLPLPRPFVSSNYSVVTENGSASVSSVSSSDSVDDQRPFDIQRSRSPGPATRGPTSPRSPHTKYPTMNLESPVWRQEDSRCPCPLPLPPGSPTSPSSVLSPRTLVPESPNSKLLKWKRGKLLGHGTFGNVYVGFNSETGQMSAIKEVRVASDDRSFKESLKQLNQEINLLSQLSHPNIVQYYGSEMDEENLYVFLEYMSGGSIHRLLQEYGPLKEPVIQIYTRQILSGLAYLHGKSVVHRDIKGANILVGTNSEIKLVDFGMAKHITSFASVLSFKGSPYWIAPEVVMNTKGYSFAVDIWSLGCTILEMATSKPPWSQYEGVAAIFKIGNSKEIPEIPDHLSRNAKSFIRLCLQRNPQARPTASQLLDHPFIRAIDGTRTPQAPDLHSHRQPIGGPADLSHETDPKAMSSRALLSPRESFPAITSLPVSRCSSPLRQSDATYGSCIPSPPHPYSPAGQDGLSNSKNGYFHYLISPKRRHSFDPPFQSQNPVASPRSRII
ncbi:hypothetical protein SAY87_017111 [Trapa incisa]|uniref:mitogen-activated protein kinase kinase kinase n=1 Tax=Trapa incisa TaxID=236973 RepID=A0AAN7L9T5_9MYRT|nr:hypothetical protein SAY87_017111 [Trapa incisa]